MAPSPSPVHQALGLLLGSALIRSCPQHLFVTQANDVRVSPGRCLAPDLLVVTLEAAKSRAPQFQATDVVLAVEIVSPETRGLDWTTKPIAYTFAKIPLCWVVETDGELSVNVFELDPDDEVYWPAQTFTGDDTISLERPWPIEIPLSTIRPRNL